jgi:GMP synthase-like glutamine amidotransferase
MRVIVLQHAACEGPGEIARWAEARGHTVTVRHLYAGDALPALGEFDLLVVMGGEMNIYQYRDYPWLKPERELIAAAMQAGKWVIGICLGAQLIADALGARVTQTPIWEIGWFPVDFTPEARKHFPRLPASATVLHWHGDTFELPRGALRLAANDACPEQGFVIDGKCLGLQFHLEMDADLVQQTVDGSSDYSLWPKGPCVQTPETILAGAGGHSGPNKVMLDALLDAFVAK